MSLQGVHLDKMPTNAPIIIPTLLFSRNYLPMHFPIDFYIAGNKIDSHFVFETLAFVVGFRYFLYLRRRTTDQLGDHKRVIITTMAALGALLGSRVLGVLENPEELARNAGNFIYYFSSKTVVGGFLGGLIGTEVTKKIMGEHRSSGDLLTYPILLALIIGRIGCFLSGIEDSTYGTPSTLPWAMDLGDGILRHPTALYEIVYLISIWVTIKQLEKRTQLADGSKFKLFMVAYLGFRLAVEFIKPVYVLPFGFSVIQIACIGGILYYWKTILKPKTLLDSASHAQEHL